MNINRFFPSVQCIFIRLTTKLSDKLSTTLCQLVFLSPTLIFIAKLGRYKMEIYQSKNLF